MRGPVRPWLCGVSPTRERTAHVIKSVAAACGTIRARRILITAVASGVIHGLALSGCSITPSTGPFSCKGGEACPPGQSCGSDFVCHDTDRDTGTAEVTDAGPPPEARADGGVQDGGARDSGKDAGSDGGDKDAGSDGGDKDAGSDGGMKDAGSDGGEKDAGPDGGRCDPLCSQPTPVCEQGSCFECSAGTERCEGNSPSRCSADHKWEAKAPCGGETPVCSNGTCAGARVVGSIVTSTDPMPSTGTRLINSGLVVTPPICGEVKGRQVCVRGGLIP